MGVKPMQNTQGDHTADSHEVSQETAEPWNRAARDDAELASGRTAPAAPFPLKSQLVVEHHSRGSLPYP